MGYWLLQNWFTLLNAVGIVGSLVFTAFSLRSETKTRRIANLLVITQNHREIWSELYKRPELARVLNAGVDLKVEPVRLEEELFVNFLLLHLSAAYRAMKDDVFVKQEGLREDIRRFFSLPIPAAIWEKLKPLQDDDFAAYLESARLTGDSV
jgi:hypothetical protein